MKLIIFSVLAIASTQISATEIKVSGSSAKALFTELDNRSHGVTQSESKSTLGSPIALRNLHGLIECGKKDGWVFTSYRCRIDSTENTDLNSRTVISLSENELDDLIAGLNHEVNKKSVSSFGGLSAKVTYNRVKDLTEDKSFYTNSGQTRWLKRDYEGVGIDEVYCQKIQGVFGEKYKCVLPNVRASDTNAPATVIVDE